MLSEGCGPAINTNAPPPLEKQTMNIDLNRERIEAFCRKWKIREFTLFGSVLRNDFRPDSDVDVMIVFESGVRPQIDDWLDMEDELTAIFGRRVDLVEKSRVINPFIQHQILRNHQVLYAA
jgi:uncharacterized protein